MENEDRKRLSILKFAEYEKNIEEEETKFKKTRRVSFSAKIQIKTIDESLLDLTNGETSQNTSSLTAKEISKCTNNEIMPFYKSSNSKDRINVSDMDFGNNTSFFYNDEPTIINNVTFSFFEESQIINTKIKNKDESIQYITKNTEQDSYTIVKETRNDLIDSKGVVNTVTEHTEMSNLNSIEKPKNHFRNILFKLSENKDKNLNFLKDNLREQIFKLKLLKKKIYEQHVKTKNLLHLEKKSIVEMSEEKNSLHNSIVNSKCIFLNKISIDKQICTLDENTQKLENDLKLIKKENLNSERNVAVKKKENLDAESLLASNLKIFNLRKLNIHNFAEHYGVVYAILRDNDQLLRTTNMNCGTLKLSYFYENMSLDIQLPNYEAEANISSSFFAKFENNLITSKIIQNKKIKSCENFDFCFCLIENDLDLKHISKKYNKFRDIPMFCQHMSLVCKFAENLSEELNYFFIKYKNTEYDKNNFLFTIDLPSFDEKCERKIKFQFAPQNYYQDFISVEVIDGTVKNKSKLQVQNCLRNGSLRNAVKQFIEEFILK